MPWSMREAMGKPALAYNLVSLILTYYGWVELISQLEDVDIRVIELILGGYF